MEVKDAATAREWLDAWGEKAFSLSRAESLARDMEVCAGLCRVNSPETKKNFLEAAKVLREAEIRFKKANLS